MIQTRVNESSREDQEGRVEGSEMDTYLFQAEDKLIPPLFREVLFSEELLRSFDVFVHLVSVFFRDTLGPSIFDVVL